MPYCITLRSRTDANITGWYAGKNCVWSTDRTRQKRFGNPQDASAVRNELRSRCPRDAKVINIEVSQDDDQLRPVSSLALLA
jgi:hypothetical protein